MKFCPYTLLRLCRDCGVHLERKGETLVACFDKPLIPEMRDALRRHKAELLAILPDGKP